MAAGGRGGGLEEARALEQSGQTDAAVTLYLRLGAQADAARALVAAGRYGDAGELILRTLGVPEEELGRLDQSGRSAARKAAQCFVHAGQGARANAILATLGEGPVRTPPAAQPAVKVFGADDGRTRTGAAGRPPAPGGSPPHPARPASSGPVPAGGPGGEATRLPAPPAMPDGAASAAEALSASAKKRHKREAGWRDARQREASTKMMIADLVAGGKLGHAARVAWDAGLLDQAAEWFTALEMHYEAGMVLYDLHRPDAALAHLMMLDADHKHYRRACEAVLDICNERQHFDFEVDRFIATFSTTRPAKASEVDSFLSLARFYQAQGFDESARDVLGRVLSFAPESEEAAAMLARLTPEKRPSQRARRSSGSGPLPDLPPLDGFATGGPRKESPARRTPAPQATSAPPAKLPSVRPELPDFIKQQLVTLPKAAPVPGAASSKAAQPAERAARAVRETEEALPAAPASNPPGSGPGPSADPKGFVGEVVAQRYRLDEQLGQGGMAVVWLARDLELEEDVAIKLLLPGGDMEEALRRFRQELTLARQLAHKNIVRVFDIGVAGRTRFITMEALQGRPLDEMLRSPVPYGVGLGWLSQVCAGLRVAHDQGIVHRDIKPANIFITKAGVVKLMDFGISKLTTAQRGLTLSGSLVGTPEYMAPEQIDTPDQIGPATDLYALGVVMFEMFTLRCPFEHEHLTPLLRMIVEQPAPSPRSLDPGLPASLEAIILQLLEKEPGKRVTSATELARALRAIAQELR